MDILVITDFDSTRIDKYWIDIIVTQTKKYLTAEELESEEIDNFYFQYQDYSIVLVFYHHVLSEQAFIIFYRRCVQACNDYPNTDDAKAFYVNWKQGSWRERNVLNDYADPGVKKRLLRLGQSLNYFDTTSERIIDYEEVIGFLMRWWHALLRFLDENYNPPAESKTIS